MSKYPWRSCTVVVFAILLVVQGYFSFVIKPEPYPSIRMPNFGFAAAEDGTFEISMARAEVLTSDGSLQSLSPAELMAEFRFSTARPSYDYLFLSDQSPGVTPAVKNWLRERIKQLGMPGSPVEIRMCWHRPSVSVKDASIVRDTPCTWRSIRL